MVAQSSPYVTWTIMAFCVAAFLATMSSGIDVIAGSLGMVPLAVADGEIWRLLTSPFLHAGLLHLGFNMLVLYLLGPALEAILGHLRFLVLYLLAGLGGSTLSYLLLDPASVSIGASGAIFGLMGALIVAGRRFSYDVRQVVILLVINLVISFVLGSFIDWRAHVGGLVVGSLVAAILAHAPGRGQAWFQVAGCALVVVVLGSLVWLRTEQLANSGSRTGGTTAFSTGFAQMGRTTAV